MSPSFTIELHATRELAERAVAAEIVALVRAKPALVLGLATGDSPRGVYRELVRAHERDGVDFSRVRAFNLDEYVGLAPDDPRSFGAYVRAELEGAGFRREHLRLPDTTSVGTALDRACLAYERAIRDAGGIDLQLLGIGRNGHIGFNEPGSGRATRTRLVELHPSTREDAAKGFGGLASVPLAGVTVGIATILEARAIRVLAFGAKKAAVVHRTLEERPDADWPASFLHEHADATLVVDAEAFG